MISVIMATYNREATLQRAIGSVARQTYGDWELVIVDDGSRTQPPQSSPASSIPVSRFVATRGTAVPSRPRTPASTT